MSIGSPAELEQFLTDQPPTSAAMRAWYQTGLARFTDPRGGTAATLTGHDLSPAFSCDATGA